MADSNSFLVKYDAAADVLYINISNEPAARGIEDENGIVWRYSEAGTVIGATIVDFFEQWVDRQGDLANEISRHFRVPSNLATSVIGKGFLGHGDRSR